MKKIPICLYVVTLLLLFLYGCKREELASKIESSAFSIDQAKNWFVQNTVQNEKNVLVKAPFRIMNGLPENKKTLLWKFAIQKKNKQVEAVEVPYNGTAMLFELPDSTFKNTAEKEKVIAGVAKRIVIYKKPNGSVDLMLVHIVPDYNYLSTHPRHNRDNFFLTLDKDFTGWIYTYDWNENPKSVSEIKKGKLVKGRTRIIRDSSEAQTNNRYLYTCFQNCSPVYIGTVGANCGNPGDPYYDDCVYNSQSATGSWTYYCRWDCGYVWVPDPPGVGNNGGGDNNPPNDCNYYGTCDPNDFNDCNVLQTALENLTGQSTSILISKSWEDDPNDQTKRNIFYKWEFFTCHTPTGDVKCVSWEKGEQKKYNGNWKWLTFWHDTHSVLNNAGIVFTGSITALSATNNILDPFGYAKVDISYIIDVKASCGPIPLHNRAFQGESYSRIDVNSF